MQERSEETRARLLEAASRLFSQYGYDATSVADLSLAAGVSKGAFYHHFSSKQAIFIALLESWLDGLEIGFRETRRSEQSVPDSIIRMAGLVGQLYQASDTQLSIFLEFWTHAYRDPTVWQAAISPYRRYQSYFSQLITEGIAEGSLEPVEPGTAARTLVSLAIGLLMQALFDPQGADWEAETRHSVQLLMAGLAKEKP